MSRRAKLTATIKLNQSKVAAKIRSTSVRRGGWQVGLVFYLFCALLAGKILLTPSNGQAVYAGGVTPDPTMTPPLIKAIPSVVSQAQPPLSSPANLTATSKGQLLVTITPQLPVASQSQVKLNVQPGLAGYARSGNWIPVVVDLDNPGPNADGELEINVAPPAGNSYTSPYGANQVQAYTTLYVQPVKLPTGSKKQVTMYVPFTGNLFNRTVVVDYNGYLNGDNQLKNLASSVTLVDVLSNNLLVGVFSPTPERFATRTDLTLPTLNTVNAGGKGGTNSNTGNTNIPTHLNFVLLDPANLPGISQSLDSLNVIMLQDYDLSVFSPAQWQAIEEWVNSGGILLLSGGAGAERALKDLPPDLDPVNPVKPSDLVKLDPATQASLEQIGSQPLPLLATGSSTLLARLTPVIAATPLLKYGNAGSLAVGLSRGNGAVIMSALDLADQRLLDWNGVAKYWAALLHPYLLSAQVFSSYNLYGINAAYLSNGLYGALVNVPGLAIPSLRVIAALALIYIILVGPLSYFVLKILKRRELAWLVLPLITIIFGGSIYLFALKDKGTDLITSSVSVVRLPDSVSGPNTRPVLQMLGVFAPKDNNYTVDLQPDTLLRSVDLPQYFQPPPPTQFGQPAAPTPTPLPPPPVGLKITQGDHSQIDLEGMKQWTFRSVLAEGQIKLDGNLDSDLAEVSGYITGTVTNHTGHALRDVAVVGTYGFQKLGDLVTGQTATVNFKTVFGQQSGPDGLFFNAGGYQGNPNQNSSAAQRTEQRKQTIVQNIGGILPNGFNSNGYYGSYGRYGPQHDNNALAILGWSDQPLLNYTVNQHKIGGNDLTLFVSTPQLNMQRSNELLPGLLQGTVSDVNSQPSTLIPTNGSQTSSPINPGYNGGTTLQVGAVTVDYNLSQFGPSGALRQAGKQLTALTLLNQAFVPPTGYSQPKPLKYQTEIYNWRTQTWDIVPAYVAPPLCMSGLQPYTGGTILAPLQFLQAASVGNSPNTMTCRQVSASSPNGPVTATPVQSAVTATTVRTTSPTNSKGISTPTPGSLVTATSAPQRQGVIVSTVIISAGGGYNYGGQNLSFSILGDGPDFKLTDHINADGLVRVRYTRDDSNTDQVVFINFSIGYTTQ